MRKGSWIIIDNKKNTKLSNKEFFNLMKKHNIKVGYFPIDKLIPSNKNIKSTDIKDGYQKHFSQIMFPIIGKNYSEISLSDSFGPSYIKKGEIVPISNNDFIKRGTPQLNEYECIKDKLEKVIGKNTISNNFQDYLILFNFIFCSEIGLFQAYLTKIRNQPNTTYLTGYQIGEQIKRRKWLITDDCKGVFTNKNREKLNKEFNINIMGSNDLIEKLKNQHNNSDNTHYPTY